MKKMSENYFIKRYTQPLTVDSKIRYRPEEELPPPQQIDENGRVLIYDRVLSFCVAAEPCVTLVILAESQEEGIEGVRRFFLYDTQERSFRMLPYILPDEETPLQIGYRKEMLVLRYEKRVDIVSIRSSSVVTIREEVLQSEAGERIYLLDKQREKVLVYGYNAHTEGETASPDSRKIVAIEYMQGLHFLTRDNGTLYLDSVKFAEADADTADSFAWLSKEEFLICGGKGVFYCTDGSSVKTAEKCDTLDSDCIGNMWLLVGGRIVKFVRKSFYERKLERSIVFDSFKEDTVWNGIKLDAQIEEHTSVEVEVVSESKRELFVNAKEILLYGHNGRTLKVKLTLTSDSTRTLAPKVRSLKSIFDATAYIDYLPPFYKEEPETLHRFLSIFQTVSKELESSVADVWKMIDADLCDESFLSWLSGWLGLQRDYRWPERKWREFLKQAPELYAMSGTKKGLKELLEIYTGAEPVIEEYDEPGKRYFFCVRIDPDRIDEGADMEVIRAIVEEYKPAHTVARVFVGYELDKTPQIVVGKSVLPFNTVIENEKE